jgi:hypothetical protein
MSTYSTNVAALSGKTQGSGTADRIGLFVMIPLSAAFVGYDLLYPEEEFEGKIPHYPYLHIRTRDKYPWGNDRGPFEHHRERSGAPPQPRQAALGPAVRSPGTARGLRTSQPARGTSVTAARRSRDAVRRPPAPALQPPLQLARAPPPPPPPPPHRPHPRHTPSLSWCIPPQSSSAVRTTDQQLARSHRRCQRQPRPLLPAAAAAVRSPMRASPRPRPRDGRRLADCRRPTPRRRACAAGLRRPPLLQLLGSVRVSSGAGPAHGCAGPLAGCRSFGCSSSSSSSSSGGGAGGRRPCGSVSCGVLFGAGCPPFGQDPQAAVRRRCLPQSSPPRRLQRRPGAAATAAAPDSLPRLPPAAAVRWPCVWHTRPPAVDRLEHVSIRPRHPFGSRAVWGR